MFYLHFSDYVLNDHVHDVNCGLTHAALVAFAWDLETLNINGADVLLVVEIPVTKNWMTVVVIIVMTYYMTLLLW